MFPITGYTQHIKTLRNKNAYALTERADPINLKSNEKRIFCMAIKLRIQLLVILQ